MKVLIVDPDSARASSVVDALAESGVEPAVAPSASFALTMLEWNQQDVIISRANVGDMEGPELCAFVRADPSTKGVRFVLVANDVTSAQAMQIGIDLVIPEGLIGHAVVTRVMHLMRRDAETGGATSAANRPATSVAAAVASPSVPVPAPPPAPPPPSPPPPSLVAPPPTSAPVPVATEPVAPTSTPSAGVAPLAVALAPAASPPSVAPAPPPPGSPTSTPAPPAGKPAAVSVPPGAAPAPPPLTELDSVGLNGAMRTFQGALGTLALEDLAKAIATRSKTGRLLLVLGTGGGMIAFDGGRIVHAEVGNTTGETAFQTLVAASHRESGGKFCFIPSDPRDLANVSKTITRSVPDLLLGASKAMDEEK